MNKTPLELYREAADSVAKVEDKRARDALDAILKYIKRLDDIRPPPQGLR